MTLPIKKLRGGLFPKYRLEEDYKFEFRHEGKHAYFVIPKGFEYDGATLGSFLFWRRSLHEEPFTLAHDWIYANKGKVGARWMNNNPAGKISKAVADDIFLQGARRDTNVQGWRDKIASGVFKTVAWIYWVL